MQHFYPLGEALISPKPLESSQSNHKSSLTNAVVKQKIGVRALGGFRLGSDTKKRKKSFKDLRISGSLP